MPSASDNDDYKRLSGSVNIPVQEMPALSDHITPTSGKQKEQFAAYDQAQDQWRKTIQFTGPGTTESPATTKLSTTSAGTVATTGSTGTSSKVPFTVAQVSSAAGTPTTLAQFTLKAGALAANGQWADIEIVGSFGSVASADKQITITLGSTAVFSTGPLTGYEGLTWRVVGRLVRIAVGLQRVFLELQATGMAPIVMGVASAENLASSITLTVSGSGTNASDVVVDGYRIDSAQ